MADTLKEKLRDDLNSARRERDKLRTLVLTTTLSELKNREIELGHDLSDSEVVEVVQRAIKRRREASEQIRAAGRGELADKEDAEAAILAVYMPKQMDEAEVRELIRSAIAEGANNIGAVMQKVSPATKGRFEGKEVNRIAREMLGG